MQLGKFAPAHLLLGPGSGSGWLRLRLRRPHTCAMGSRRLCGSETQRAIRVQHIRDAVAWERADAISELEPLLLRADGVCRAQLHGNPQKTPRNWSRRLRADTWIRAHVSAGRSRRRYEGRGGAMSGLPIGAAISPATVALGFVILDGRPRT
jgi:hypothetical protein